MTNAPKRIGLGPHGNCWADEDIKDGDTVYIRADLVPQWQPIETAPKDGTQILATDGKWTASGCVSNCNYFWFRISHFAICQEYEWSPTHWMPLPTPQEE